MKDRVFGSGIKGKEENFVLKPVAFAILSSVAAHPWSQAPVVSLTTHDLPPYSFPVEGKAPSGIAVQTVQCAAEALSISVNIGFFPWKRAQEMVKNNSADGFFAASQANQRDAYAVLSATIAPQEWRWYLLKQSTLDPRSDGFKEIARTSSFHGANMQDWLMENGYKTDGSPLQSRSLLTMLKKGRVDAILANRLVMEQLLAEVGETETVKSYLAMDRPLGIYFSKAFLSRQNPDYLTRWNQAIARCTGPKAMKSPAAAH